MVSSPRTSKKPHAVLSFITWDQRHKDLRGLLSQALQTEPFFSEGYVLNAIETDASEEMGEPLLWYPVAHVTQDSQPPMYSQDTFHYGKRTLGSNFLLLQDYYYEYTKLTLVVDKGGGSGISGKVAGRGSGIKRSSISPIPEKTLSETTVINQLVLAYKSLEDPTDPGLLAGWVRWSGAWEAYNFLRDKRLPVSSISFYVRERVDLKLRRPKETFKYVVTLEIRTTSPDELQQLRAATQRLRVERWSGYICLYTVHTLQNFTESFSSNDSITKIVDDAM
ncbi:hypothetical protein SK128_003320 [Halocaridina rubra]|uniref:DUF7153 domain-containing protein n=1 Tax=Halocaridina rubra TaxID=373956 RepID=A0AAN9A1J2_HALRR